MEKRSDRGPLMAHCFSGCEDRLIRALRPDISSKKDLFLSAKPRKILYIYLLLLGFIMGCGAPLGWFLVERTMGLSGNEIYYRGVLYIYLTLSSIAVFMVIGMVLAVRIEKEQDAKEMVYKRDEIIEKLGSAAEDIRKGFKEDMIKVSNSAVSISKASDEQQVLHTLMRTIKNNLDFDRILILVRNGDSLAVSNCYGVTEKNVCDMNMEIPYSDLAGAFSVVCREGESCMFSEEDYIPVEFRMKPPYSNLDRFRSKAFMVVPIRRPGESEAYGVLAADRKYTKRDISENDLILVELLADMAGSTISRIELNRDLERQASLDELTQICNRRRWMDSAEHAMKTVKRYGGELSMIMIDIDNFKSINDTWGHQSGDKVLRETAAIIKEHSREADIVGRYGGEEFVILCPRGDLSSTVEMAERLRGVIAATSFGIPRGVTATFGVAQATREEIESLNMDSLLSKADKALYAGKSREGKNCVVTWKEIEDKLSPLRKDRVPPMAASGNAMRNAV